MFLVNIISVVLALFLAYYLLYCIYIVYCASKYNLWKIKYKYPSVNYYQNLNVTVYSHNNGNDVVELLEQLKRQDYPQDKYKINIILDNCTDGSPKLLEIIGGARLWRINSEDGEPIGQNAAIEWYVDRVLATDYTNGFVFLNAENKVDINLLDKVNAVLKDYSVVIGHRVPKEEGNRLTLAMRKLLDKIHSEIVMKGRSMAELQLTIDTSVMAIRQETLEKIRFITVENQSFEYLYSMLLAKSDISTIFYDEVKVYDKNKTTLSGLFKKYYNIVKYNCKSFVQGMKYICRSASSVKFKEYAFSLVYPNDLMLIVLLGILVYCSGIPDFAMSYKIPYFLTIAFVLTAVYLILVARVKFKEILLYPLQLFGELILPLGAKVQVKPLIEKIPALRDINFEMIKKMPVKIVSRISGFMNRNKEPEDAYDVYLTNGSRCKLQIIEEDGLVRAVLWFNKKRMTSLNHIKTSGAIEELSDKLLSRGFALKICQNCGYFEEKRDGRYNSNEGKCFCGVIKDETRSPYSVYLWSQCNNIIPSHAREYIQKQLENIRRENGNEDK